MGTSQERGSNRSDSQGGLHKRISTCNSALPRGTDQETPGVLVSHFVILARLSQPDSLSEQRLQQELLQIWDVNSSESRLAELSIHRGRTLPVLGRRAGARSCPCSAWHTHLLGYSEHPPPHAGHSSLCIQPAWGLLGRPRGLGHECRVMPVQLLQSLPGDIGCSIWWWRTDYQCFLWTSSNPNPPGHPREQAQSSWYATSQSPAGWTSASLLPLLIKWLRVLLFLHIGSKWST